jgi:hypothetical protein
MDGLTLVFGSLLVLYGCWNFKRNCRKAADAANKLSPETKTKALGLLKRWLK